MFALHLPVHVHTRSERERTRELEKEGEMRKINTAGPALQKLKC